MGEDLARLYPALAVGGAAGSGVFTAMGAQAQGAAIERASQIEARTALRESSQSATRIRTEGRRELGKQRAAQGTTGIQSAGSPLQLMVENAIAIERRAMEVTVAGRYEADVARMRGKVAKKAARGVGAASLLEGASRAAYYGHELL